MNYGDNLYYVNELLKLLDYSLKLDLDTPLNGEYLTGQLVFIDKVLTSLYEDSGKINGLSHYEDALRSIMKSKYRLCSFLGTLESAGESLRRRIHLDDKHIGEIKNRHQAHIDRIEGHFADKDNLKTPEDLVSQEEFRYLFGADDTE